MQQNQNFIAACVQLNSQNDLQANINKASELITKAVAAGAKFITLPENAFYMAEKYVDLLKISTPMQQHPAIIEMQNLAKNLKVFILVCLGVVPENSIEIEQQTNRKKLANRSVVIADNGEIISFYDKIHLFDANVKDDQTYTESESFISGNKAVLTDLPWGKLGQAICYDVRFAKLFRTLAKTGAKFITVPAAFTYKTGIAHWHTLLRARAIENSCYIIAPAQCGHHPRGRQTYGHSLIINPWGEIIAEAPEAEEGFIIADISPALVDEIRENLPSLKHDRNFEI